MPSESNGHIDLDHEFHNLVRQADLGRGAPDIGMVERPRVVSAPTTGTIGAVAVGKRIQELFTQAQELHKVAEILATALAGPTVAAPMKAGTPPRQGQHLFARQMQGLDEVSMMLDSVRQAIERAARSLT